MNTRELRTDRAKLIEDARSILKASTVSAEDQAKANLMLDDADKIKASIDLNERADAAELETRIVKPLSQPVPGAGENLEARQRAAFRQYITTGTVSPENARELRVYNQSKMAPEYRDLLAAGGSDGGYLIPTFMGPNIEVAMKAFGPIVTKVTNWNTDSGNPISWPLNSDVTAYSQEMTVGTAVSESDVAFGQVTFNTSTFTTGMVKISRSLLQDSAFNLDSFIRDTFGTRVARGLNKAVTLGSTSGNVQSIVTAATVGATSAAPTAVSYIDLVNVYSSLDSSYLPGANWAFNNTTLRSLMSLEDTLGRSLFLQSLTSGVPDTVLGKPYFLDQDLASPAATTTSILFGAFDKYMLRNVGGGLEVLVLPSLFAASYEIGMVGFHRQSGKLLDAGTHPIVSLQQHA